MTILISSDRTVEKLSINFITLVLIDINTDVGVDTPTIVQLYCSTDNNNTAVLQTSSLLLREPIKRKQSVNAADALAVFVDLVVLIGNV